MSADILHLLFINMFVMYLEATVLVYVNEMDKTARAPIQPRRGPHRPPSHLRIVMIMGVAPRNKLVAAPRMPPGLRRCRRRAAASGMPASTILRGLQRSLHF